MSPAIRDSRVDFPLPEGPTRLTFSSSWMSRSTDSSTAVRASLGAVPLGDTLDPEGDRPVGAVHQGARVDCGAEPKTSGAVSRACSSRLSDDER